MRKFILLLMCVFAVSLIAGITGKIVGRVYDLSTGEALPGVNVIIEGTTMGAATDPDGYFVILNVPPGTYSVTARMMGYRDVTKTDARVEADLTRTLEFPLASEAIAVKGVIVRAKRPIIKKDVTTSVSIVSAEDMEAIPVNTIEGVVSRQAGIISDGGDLHVRGGRDTEIVFVVDGIEMVDPMSGSFDSHIPQESVEETSVYTGGFGAEYGSAQSGVVNVITKSGGSDFHFTLKARTNDAFGIEGLQKFLDDNEKYDTTYLSVIEADSGYGNIFPYEGRMISISPNGEDTVYRYISPEGDTNYYEGEYDMVTYPERGSGVLKTVFVNDTLIAEDWQPEKMKRIDFTLSGPIIGKTLRFFVGGEYFKDEGHHPNYGNTRQTYTGKVTFKPAQAFKLVINGLYNTNEYRNYYTRWKFNLDNALIHNAKSYSLGLNLTHAINPRIIHEFKVNQYYTSLLYNIFEDDWKDEDGDGILEEGSDGIDDFADVDNDQRVEINGVERINPETGEAFKWPELTIYPFTRDKNLEGFMYSGYFRHTYGWDEKRTTTAKWDLTAQIGKIHELKLGISGRLYDIFDYGADGASGGNWYMAETEADPYHLAVYIQDKLEQESFVLNAGFRFDYYNAKDVYPEDPSDPVYDVAFGGEIKNPVPSESRWAISPRIGFSFPITEYDKFHFTYGHYFQTPPMNYLFYNQTYDFSGAYPMVGNPNIEPEKTVSYEAGIQHAFNDEVLLDITAFMKDITGLTDTEQVFYTLVAYYTRYTNYDYGSARGIEVEFSKRRGGTPAWLMWNINYTFGVARGKSSSYRQNYDYIWSNYVVPTKEHYIDWDQRHTLRADIGIHAPEGEALFGVPGFDNFGVTFTTSYGSGLPWTPPSGTRVQLINEERLPYTLRTDVRFYKNIEVGRMKIGLFGDIYNLFNRENINRYYLEYSDNQSSYAYEDFYYLYGDPAGSWDDPRVYDPKRYMRFGLSLKW